MADANLSTPFQQPAGKGIGFYTGDDGFLYCDSQKIDDIREQVPPPPASPPRWLSTPGFSEV